MGQICVCWVRVYAPGDVGRGKGVIIGRGGGKVVCTDELAGLLGHKAKQKMGEKQRTGVCC